MKKSSTTSDGNDLLDGDATAFRRPAARPKPVASSAPQAKPQLPVALIFMCLAVVYVSIRYYFR